MTEEKGARRALVAERREELRTGAMGWRANLGDDGGVRPDPPAGSSDSPAGSGSGTSGDSGGAWGLSIGVVRGANAPLSSVKRVCSIRSSRTTSRMLIPYGL